MITRDESPGTTENTIRKEEIPIKCKSYQNVKLKR